MAKRAVLLLAHGTPERLDQIPEYLRNVVGGRPVSDELVREIQHRYGLIGQSPLTEITLRQGQLLEAELERTGDPVQVYVGMRNWHPYIADTVARMRTDGVEEAVVICLAPQNSRTSVGLYRRAVEAAAEGIRIDFTEGWASHPLLIAAFAERLRATWSALSREVGEPVPVLFTAHSVPVRTVQPAADGPGGGGDSYVDDARQTAALVAAEVAGIPSWDFAFQSQGAGGGPWMGPTVEEKLDEFVLSGGETLILHPIGFLCDHVEILYDIDILFQEKAAERGIRLVRPASLNESSTLVCALADLVGKGWERVTEM